MKLNAHLKSMLISSLLLTLCVTQASALEYGFDSTDDSLFATPTSQDVIYQQEDQNVNRSKTAALIAPGFGTPTSYLRGSGEYLTPNLAPGAMDGSLVNSVNGDTYTDSGAGGYPAPDTSIGTGTYPPAGNEGFTFGYTNVTSNLYYADGSLGTLKIPSIGLTVKVFEGTGSAPLLKGAGHFEDTSIWNGNIAIAGHNRGVRNDFGKIHTLKAGDTITFTTALGTRTYAVSSVTKVDVTDTSGLHATAGNQITLYTCVMNQPA